MRPCNRPLRALCTCCGQGQGHSQHPEEFPPVVFSGGSLASIGPRGKEHKQTNISKRIELLATELNPARHQRSSGSCSYRSDTEFPSRSSCHQGSQGGAAPLPAGPQNHYTVTLRSSYSSGKGNLTENSPQNNLYHLTLIQHL